jgi:hypothetical protein
MQFDPDNYPVADYKFNATSTLGIIAREYEVTQLVQLLQTMKQDSPIYPVLIQSIIENMNLSNREELIASMTKAQEPDPQQQQMAQMAQQAQMEFQQSQTAALMAQAAESQARAGKYGIETQLAPQELEIDKISAITRNLQAGDQDDKEFERRLRIAEVALKETELTDKRSMAEANKKSGEKEQALFDSLMSDGPSSPPQAPSRPMGPRGPNVGPAPEVA